MSIPPVAIVTGAGSGIGAAACEMLCDRGWRLALVGRRESTLQETVDRLAESVADPGETLLLPADVAARDQACSVVDMTVERWGRVDALVNNAGTVRLVPLDECDEDLLFTTFAVNAFGPAYLIARCWPLFVRHGGGRVVNVTSMATVDPFPGLSAYAAAKSALDSLTRSLHVEGRDHGIRAFSVAPGAVETAMLRSIASTEELPPARTLDPAEVAAEIVACVTGERDGRAGEAILLPSGG